MLFSHGSHDQIIPDVLHRSQDTSRPTRSTSTVLLRRGLSCAKGNPRIFPSSFPRSSPSQMAFFVLGNFISTNEILYEYVDELTPFLVQALNDTISKIRSHAVSTYRSSTTPSCAFFLPRRHPGFPRALSSLGSSHRPESAGEVTRRRLSRHARHRSGIRRSRTQANAKTRACQRSSLAIDFAHSHPTC